MAAVMADLVQVNLGHVRWRTYSCRVLYWYLSQSPCPSMCRVPRLVLEPDWPRERWPLSFSVVAAPSRQLGRNL
eukprot:1516811-Pyramimonas_sp.AAC.1